jgi:uncharacterized membrane protein
MLAIPMHPLLVHIPVVIVPLAALGVVAIAVRPKLMPTFGWVVAGLGFVGFVGTVLAGNTGETLLQSYRNAGQTISPTLQHHADLGSGAKKIAAIFFLFTVLWVGFAWWRARIGEEQATAKVKKPKVLAIVLLVLAVASGIGATTSMVVTGHEGAKSHWGNK